MLRNLGFTRAVLRSCRTAAHAIGRGQARVVAMSTSTSAEGAQGPRVVARKELAATRWMRLMDLQWVTGGKPNEQPKSWNCAERTTTEPGAIDAVCCFTIIKKKGAEPRLLIVKQFRPPIGKFTVELCAGLIDPGETPEVAALRELKEETGYTGVIVGSTGRQYLSPGLSPECVVTCFVEVDADAPENQHPTQAHDDAGLISLETLSVSDLWTELQRLEAEGFAIWVGLWTFAQGMRINSLMPGLLGTSGAK